MSDLPAGRALDVEIATKVFGRTVVALDWPCAHDPECGQYQAEFRVYPEGVWTGERGPVYVPDGGTWPPIETPDEQFARLGPGFTRADLAGTPWVLPYADVRPVPFYSTDISAAWDVVEHLREQGYDVGLYAYTGQEISVEVFYKRTPIDDSTEVVIQAATAPLAICRAALATLGQKE